MYGNLKSSEKYSKIKFPSSELSTNEEFYDKFKSVIINAQGFNIWSFEQIGLFDPFPEELMETEF